MRLIRLLKQLSQFVLVQVVALAAMFVTSLVSDRPVLTLAAGVAAAAVAVLAYCWIVRITERRRVAELALEGSVPRGLVGALIGFALFAAVIGAMWMLGGYTVIGLGSIWALIAQVGIMAVVAVTEELAFRGALFRILEERFGTWVALAGTSVLFGAMHLINPDATLWGAFTITVEAGVLLGAAYIATRSLWLPIGLHFAWNLAGAGIFGTVVSGNGANVGLLQGETNGPMLLTGGAFGPEGSILAMIACLAVAAVFLVVAHRRGRIVGFLPARRTDRAQDPAAASLAG